MPCALAPFACCRQRDRFVDLAEAVSRCDEVACRVLDVHRLTLANFLADEPYCENQMSLLATVSGPLRGDDTDGAVQRGQALELGEQLALVLDPDGQAIDGALCRHRWCYLARSSSRMFILFFASRQRHNTWFRN